MTLEARLLCISDLYKKTFQKVSVKIFIYTYFGNELQEISIFLQQIANKGMKIVFLRQNNHVFTQNIFLKNHISEIKCDKNYIFSNASSKIIVQTVICLLWELTMKESIV